MRVRLTMSAAYDTEAGPMTTIVSEVFFVDDSVSRNDMVEMLKEIVVERAAGTKRAVVGPVTVKKFEAKDT